MPLCWCDVIGTGVINTGSSSRVMLPMLRLINHALRPPVAFITLYILLEFAHRTSRLHVAVDVSTRSAVSSCVISTAYVALILVVIEES